jgi:hypothetical protein
VPAQRGQAFRLGRVRAAYPLEERADLDEVVVNIVTAGRADDLPQIRPPALPGAVDNAHRPKSQAGCPAAVAGLARPDSRHE